jgi:hypothetical protein
MLHQQYICNHYNTIEQQRLHYHRIKDTDLTGEDFGMMQDAALPTDGQGCNGCGASIWEAALAFNTG